MKKGVFKKLTIVVTVVTLLVGCQEESLIRTGTEINAICNTCPEPPDDPTPPTPQPPRCQGKPDLIITSVFLGGLPSQSTPYTVTIKNIGLATASLNHQTNRLSFQGWFSNDGINKIPLAPACGSYFYQILAPGASVSESIGCTNAPYASYPYLIVELTAQNPTLLNECSVTNNKFALRLH